MTNTELSAKELQKFAVITALMIGVVFGGLFPFLWDARFPTWPWIAAGVLATWGIIAPTSLAKPYQWWMRLALALGWINNRIILSLVFFLLFVPFGAMRRLLGGDPMRRRLDASSDSYRIEKRGHTGTDLRRPY